MSRIYVDHRAGDDLVVFTVKGKIDLPALIAATDAHYAAHATHRTLFDLRDADGSNLSFREMKTTYAEQRSTHVPDGAPQSALLVRNEASLGLARLYGVITESHDTAMIYEAFLSVNEAETWLHLPRGALSDMAGTSGN